MPRLRYAGSERFPSALTAHASKRGSIRISDLSTARSKPPISDKLGCDLDPIARSLIRSALDLPPQVALDGDALHALQDMHPGIRDLRFRNFISMNCWKPQAWSVSIINSRKALARIKGLLSLDEPTEKQKFEAISDPGNLSAEQKAFLASAFAPGLNYPSDLDAYLSSLMQYQLTSIWRDGQSNLYEIAHMLHSMRYGPLERYPRDWLPDEYDRKALERLAGVDIRSIDAGTRDRILDELTKKVEDHACASPSSRYLDSILKAYGILTEGGARMDDPVSSIIAVARRCESVSTLLDFFGYPQPAIKVRMLDGDHSHSLTKMSDKAKATVRKNNEDANLSASLEYGDGRRALIDAVFDGVSSGGNGHIASAIASEVLELSLLAGWISGPEDVRRTLILADLAITNAQIAMKHSKLPTREVRMATTAAVSYQEGYDFYGIHAGDSEWAILDQSGHPIAQSQGHTFSSEIRKTSGFSLDPRLDYVTSLLGGALLYIDINNSAGSGMPIQLKPTHIVRTSSDGFSANVCDHESASVLASSTKGTNSAEPLAKMARRRARADPGQNEGFPSCSLCKHGSKNDDITISIRYSREIENR